MDSHRPPKETFDEIAALGTENLETVIAIDSQSDEESQTIPSTVGQKVLCQELNQFFENLGYHTTQDKFANLLVEVPSNLQDSTGSASSLTGQPAERPKLVFMVHMDTSRGTKNVASLEIYKNWDGSRIPYPKNDAIQVTTANFPETKLYQGEDLLFGPGDAPIGLDDKLGMAEMMTLAQILANNPQLPHGDLVFVCRPDEEIGRMEAVTGLAQILQEKGVTHGYTIDGLSPFEVNVENFNASCVEVSISGEPLDLPPLAENWEIELYVVGAKSHGATAKAEGYLNPTRIFAEALAPISRRNDIIPLGFQSNPEAETEATLRFLLRGDCLDDINRAQHALQGRFMEILSPHDWKGASLKILSKTKTESSITHHNGAMLLFAHLATFMRIPGPTPLFSEDSEFFEGYTNPYFVQESADQFSLAYRIRDFKMAGLHEREEHLKTVCQESPGSPDFEATPQYINMGPNLEGHPELIDWAMDAARTIGAESSRQPIRGGTGVDPFLAVGIPIANLGTGYFAPESEKEFTSKQNIARHVLWLVSLTQRVLRGVEQAH